MAYSESQIRISLDADDTVAEYTGISGMPGAASPNYGNQYHFVKVTGAHQCGLSSHASNEVTIGISQNKPQVVGEATEIAISGVSYLIAGTGGLTAGDIVKSDANGAGVNGTPGTDAALAVVIIAAVEGAVASVLLV